MKPPVSVLTSFLAALFMATFFASAVLAASKEELTEKIMQLELQIQQLKDLKEQKKSRDEKELQCVNVTGETKLCRCLAEALPQEVRFEEYVHNLVSTKEELKYDAMGPEARVAVDASIAAGKKCIGKGLFW
jgi:hypothetical protein